MTPDDGAAAARLDRVTHRYGRAVALDAVSLTIPAGGSVGIIGPDGVGKSTLLGLVAGVRRLQDGTVSVLGGDMRRAAHRDAVCARIAYMPQGLGRNLYATLSVRENVDFFARLFGQDATSRAARIPALLHGTGLAPFADRAAGKLSGGMRQKLALCCALVHDPDLLILDEPTTGVDPLSRRRFWALIDGLRARRPGLTVVVATAYMAEAGRFEQLVAMDGGRVLATGTPAELMAHTGTATLDEAFVACLPAPRRAGHAPLVLPPRRAADGAPAIEADGLVKRFGTFTAVDHVDLRIETGEIFGFIGSNGCGKTTTMKMLTGLLPPTEGTARLFGRPVTGGSLEMRRRVGYMAQAFSLYAELTVRQNLTLHADLFHLPRDRRAARVAAVAARFGLAEVADRRPETLPLGVRQRLQLAVAVLHEPEILILDEPTSGVDPLARDLFWRHLVDLSRLDGVTIFISTHFMNEAVRCDRVSLMHAGRVLAVGAPAVICATHGGGTLEDAFVARLEAASGESEPMPAVIVPAPSHAVSATGTATSTRRLSPSRAWAFARREATELVRDPIRLAFALLGPVVLMLAMGYGISFDVEDIAYAVLDQDRSRESRMVAEQLSSSRYFVETQALEGMAALDRRMTAGEITVALVVPPGFGHDLLAGRHPELGAWIDGSNTTRGESARGYVEALLAAFLADFRARETGTEPAASYGLETRFRYNQAFRSLEAIPPGVLMMLLMMIPAMLTAVGVVREKEMGSITNFHASPARRLEFLLGKQLPYVGVALVGFLVLVTLMLALFGLRPHGSLAALVAGAVLYTTAATAFGLVISAFVHSQIAATFATAIVVMIPTVNFSGMMYPVSTLDGAARVIGAVFPPLYFQSISSGVFNKGLGFAALWPDHAALAAFCVAFWIVAALLLRKQEA